MPPKSRPKLLPWRQVQDGIINLLKSSDSADSVLIPYGPQLAYSLHHPHTLKCMTFYHSTAGDIYVTHYDAGVSNQIQLWTINSYNDVQVRYRRFNIQPTITSMIFVPQHRVFVGFCSDLCLRVFSDAKHRMAELMATQCPTTMLCMVYNDVTDELIAGGFGAIVSWRMTHVELRGALQPGRPFDCNLSQDQWVTNLKLDKKNHQLLVQCDDGVYIINYQTNKQTHFIRNWHVTSLSSCVFYRPLEYFITAAKDGSIKVWNAIVFSIVHEFIGHHDTITGLIMHPSDPLLLSSSKDGTIRIWRLDTFEQTLRLDVGERIHAMKLANSNQLYFQTLRDVKIFNFNQFHHIFTPIQSCIYKLTRVTSPGNPSRILCIAEDGGVRLLSSVSGSILTIIYPMATYQVLTDIVYDARNSQIYTALATGEVLVFNSSTNPCTAFQLWVPRLPDEAILCLTLLKLDLALGYPETGDGESLIFAGHCNGQISLIEADTVTMKFPVQAHCGQVTTLEHSHGSIGSGRSTGDADRLMSVGTDKKVKIWSISVQDAHLYLTPIHTIKCELCPTHVSMLGNVTCLAMPNNAIDMYRLHDNDSNRDNHLEEPADHTDIHRLTHHQDDDHTKQITALCSCQKLGLFATTSTDGSVKIWNTQNQLVRELCLDHTVRGVCFANDRGDLLLGFQNHVSYIPIINYLPQSTLEKMLLEDFTDEAMEEPLEFNPDLQLWFDIRNLLALPANLSNRRLMKKVLQRLQTPSEMEGVGEDEEEEKEEKSLPSASEEEILKTLSEIAESVQEIPLSSEELTQLTELAAYSLGRIASSKSQAFTSTSTMSLPAVLSREASSLYTLVTEEKHSKSVELVEKQAEDEELKDEEKSEKEEEEEKKKPWPIAPDGYIPNSVIRALMGFKPPPIDRTPIPWKLKPVPPMQAVSETLSKTPLSPLFSDELIMWDSSEEEEEIYEYSGSEEFDEDDEFDETMPLELRRKSVAMAKQKKLKKQSLKYPPQKFHLPKFKKFEKREISKTLEEEEEQEEEVQVPPLLMKISKMPWFPSDEEVNIENVVDVLIDLLAKVTPFQHRAVCQALVDIHRELVINERQLDMAVNKLSKQLQSDHAMIRVNAVRTLGDLGQDRKNVIMGLLPTLMDKTENVRHEATAALTKLTGVTDRDGLAALLEQLGILQPYVNRDREVIGELAERFQKKYVEDSERLTAYYRSQPSGFYGADLEDDGKAPSMLELWVANTKAGLRPDDEDLSKEYSGESMADVIDDDFSPWEHSKQRRDKDTKGARTVQFKSSRSLHQFQSFDEMPYYGEMSKHFPAAERARRKHRSVARETTDGYMDRMIQQKEAIAAAMKERLKKHRRQYLAAAKPGRSKKRFLPNRADFYKYYSRRPAAAPRALKPLTKTQHGAGDRISRSDQYQPLHVKEGKLIAQPGTENNLTIVLDDKWKCHDAEGSSLFPDTDSGIHSEQVAASSVKQEQLITSDVSEMESSSSQQQSYLTDGKGSKDEKLLQQLHGMYTSTEISLGDSGVGCPSDISSLRMDHIDSLPSNMSSLRKIENWRKIFQRPTAQQRKKFYKEQRKTKESKVIKPPSMIYLPDNVEVTDGVAGQRLLKKLSVIDRKKQVADEEMHWHMVESMPAKLDVHTNGETMGKTKFGILNMTWTTDTPRYDGTAKISQEHQMRRVLERNRRGPQYYSYLTSAESVLNRIHHHWETKRQCNNLSALSKLESHYEWSNSPAVVMPTIQPEPSLPSVKSQESGFRQKKAKKIPMLPSIHMPKMVPTSSFNDRGRPKENSEEKLPEITAALKFLTTKKETIQESV